MEKSTLRLPLDKVILYCMFLLLPLDMINGILLTNNIIFPISISQFYKTIILALIFFRLLQYPKQFLLSVTLIFLLLIPSFFQIIKKISFTHLFPDFIKASKYLIPIYGFLFFRIYLKKHSSNLVFKLINISYIILIINILLKHIGIGYPMYEFGNIGSKGFFYAGNEISALLLILSSIVSFNMWNYNKFYYFLIALLNIIVSLSISSKTSVFGIVLLHVLIPIKRPTLEKINVKFFLNFIITVLISLPPLIYLSWSYVKATNIYNRLTYFYDKFDFLTFMLSNRNIFLEESFIVYIDKYSFLEKIIGVGQTNYEQLNDFKLVEIDGVDIFFTYAFIGIVIFILSLFYIGFQAICFSKFLEKYRFSNLVFMMLILLVFISSTAGHVFSSGMAGIFIGLLFSLFYIKNTNYENEV